ncbi:filamentous hemagglutinin N-terminal domain-containing protein [Calothrix sp. UHCC 0171]|uniref:two-partner secretion domain-containing protein n=1 Tax=Calothrix sp. UHCC 0171 TaxID=3110245 RepID=UPI002B20EDDD|nr:filamentous hemagglutinin N-terminal domain-containing protein [Calothrix sp. UHCC 0171]MEA5574569.1 filamentous hemagglutinin N-terminal domain-containing protein [Calothrix sp. UHCC 0171]
MNRTQISFPNLVVSSFSVFAMIIGASSFWVIAPAQAQITPDNTLGIEASKITPNVLIKNGIGDRVDGGAIRESNLFHSFSQFNINDGQRVYFSNPSGVINILTRVTGKDASNILGTLGVDGNANLFLINPNGILFGKNARLDVRGSFVGTTANGLQFGNQGVFSATNPQSPSLLTVNPSALFFNQINRNAGIQNNSIAPAGKDPAGVDVFGLRVPDGKSLLLVGGNVSMDGGWAIANGGHIELGGLIEAGSIGIQSNGDNFNLSFPEGLQRGDVLLNNRALVRVSGNGGGNIVANARNLEVLADSEIIAGIDLGLGTTNTQAGDITINTENIIVRDSQIDSIVYGQGIAGNVKIIASDSVELSGEIRDDKPGTGEDILSTNPGGILATLDVTGKGKSGNIYLETRRLSVSDGSKVQVATFGEGDAGNLFIRANEINVFETEKSNFYSTGIFATVGIDPRTVKLPKGNAGNLTIETGKLTIRNGGEIDVSTQGEGNGGQLSIKASDSIEVTGDSPYNSRISAEVGDFGVRNGDLGSGIGNGGSITIETPKLIVKDGGLIISNTSGKGNAGTIDITTGSLSVTNGGQINSLTSGQGSAGNITITAKDAISFDGVSNSNGFPSALFSLVDTGAVGNGGNINISAGSLSLTNGGTIGADVRGATDELPGGQGIGGTVDVKVRDTFTISGTDSGIFGSLGIGASGRAGNIKVQSGNLFIQDDGNIISSTFGKGDSGSISITANESIVLDVGGIYSNVQFREAVGNAGKIDITTGSLSLINGAQINSFTRGQGNAGDITVQARDAVTLDGFGGDTNYSAISSNVLAGGVGNGGNIDLTAVSLSIFNGGKLRISVNGATDELPGGQGIGGNVDVKVRDTFTISGTDSGIFGSLGTGASGRAGNIKVQSGNLFIQDDGNIISSTFGKGDSGSISITANESILLDVGGIYSNVQSREAVGNAGKIDITTGLLSLTNGAQINSFTRGQGNAGDITIQVTDVVTLDGRDSNGNSSAFFSTVESNALGNGGEINISASSLSLKNGGLISSSTYGRGDSGNISIAARDAISLDSASYIYNSVESSDAVGNAGNIEINTDSLKIVDSSGISASTLGRGNGGDINIEAKDLVAILNDSALASDVREDAIGNSGDITLTTGRLVVKNSQAGPSTLGQGNAGNFKIIATDSVELSGQVPKREGDTSIEGSVGFPGGLFAQVDLTGKGRGGNLSVETRLLSISDGSKIQAATFGDGDAGNVFIRADEIDLFETEIPNFFNTGIFAGVQTDGRVETGIADPRNGKPPKGNGGNLTIETRKLSVRDGAEVFVQTTGEGDAGKLFIRANESVNVTGVSTGTFERQRTSTVTAGASQRSTGNGGNLTIETSLLNVANGAFISTSSEGTGNAGIMTINSDRIRLDNKASLNANTRSPNKDPNKEQATINLNTSALILRRNSNITTNATGQNVIGGNININADVLAAFENSDISANSSDFRGGRVKIVSQGIFGTQPRSFPTAESDITATGANPTFSGTTEINTPDVDPTKGIIELPNDVVDATTKLSQLCPRGYDAFIKPLSSFTITGRDALPASPLEALPGTAPTPLATLDDGGNGRQEGQGRQGREENISSPTPQIIEAQGLVKTKDGGIYLVANAANVTPSSGYAMPKCPSDRN